MSRRRRSAVVLVAAVLLLGSGAAACGDEVDEGGAGEAAGDSAPYGLLRSDGWEIREAVDPIGGDPVGGFDRPSAAWWAEYVLEEPDRSSLMVLSGHDATIDETRAALDGTVGSFEAADVAGWDGAVQASFVDSAGGVVLLPAGGGTLRLLSSEVGADELVGLASSVEAVAAQEWVAAGGVVCSEQLAANGCS